MKRMPARSLGKRSGDAEVERGEHALAMLTTEQTSATHYARWPDVAQDPPPGMRKREAAFFV